MVGSFFSSSDPFHKSDEGEKSLRSVVSIHGPLGYGPSMLSLRHSAILVELFFFFLFKPLA
jgi:hypothetical protein